MVAGLTLLQEDHHFHRFVSDVLAPVEVLEPISTDLTAIQTNQVQGPQSVFMFFLVCEIAPHPSEKKNTKPRLTSLQC